MLLSRTGTTFQSVIMTLEKMIRVCKNGETLTTMQRIPGHVKEQDFCAIMYNYSRIIAEHLCLFV